MASLGRDTQPYAAPSSAAMAGIVISLHGIRTRGAWQKQLGIALQKAGFLHIPLDYGFWGLLRLLWGPSRRRQAEWFRDRYTNIIATTRNRPDATHAESAEFPHLIAHSFGSYQVARALELFPEVKFARIIFCGSIVRRDYPWRHFLDVTTQVQAVLNDYGRQDVFAAVADYVIADAGASGTHGFETDDARLVQARHAEWRHSDYFYDLNYSERWVPFLRGSTPAVVEPPRRKTNWKPALLAASLALALLLVWRWAIGGWIPARATSVPPAGPSATQETLPYRVAVLPFVSEGAGSDQQFADGIADELRDRLAGLASLRVIARDSSRRYRSDTADKRLVAQELGVDRLIVGRVRAVAAQPPSRFEIAMELIRVPKKDLPEVLWGRRFNAGSTDLFGLQVSLAQSAAEALHLVLTQGERARLTRRPTSSEAAYAAFVRGEEATNHGGTPSPPNLERAIAEFERATTLDPTFADAWAALSRSRTLLHNNGTPRPELLVGAEHAASRALSLSPGLPQALEALGLYNLIGRQDVQNARYYLDWGLRESPNSVRLLRTSAQAMWCAGDWNGALPVLRTAQQADPLASSIGRQLVLTLLFLRRYSEAHEAADRTLALDPAAIASVEYSAMVHLGEGDLDGARDVLRNARSHVPDERLIPFLANYWDLYWLLTDEQQASLLKLAPSAFGDSLTWSISLAQVSALRGDLTSARKYAALARDAALKDLEVSPSDPQVHVRLGLAYAILGRREEAVASGRQAMGHLPSSRDAFRGPYIEHQMARICLLVGNEEEAMDILERLLARPYYLSSGWLRVDPDWSNVRAGKRFQALVAGK
jgi:TolB-like protein/Flp pilus assembly protein TadD